MVEVADVVVLMVWISVSTMLPPTSLISKVTLRMLTLKTAEKLDKRFSDSNVKLFSEM